MPIYEYQCVHCGKIREIVWDKFDGGPPVIACDECGDEATKVLSRVIHKNKHKGPRV